MALPSANQQGARSVISAISFEINTRLAVLMLLLSLAIGSPGTGIGRAVGCQRRMTMIAGLPRAARYRGRSSTEDILNKTERSTAVNLAWPDSPPPLKARASIAPMSRRA